MTAQEAITDIVKVLDEGSLEIEELIESYGMHSLKAGELIDRVEQSMMNRVALVVRRYEKQKAASSET